MKHLELSSELDAAPDDDELLVAVLDGYLADLESGRGVEPELLFAQHPELAPRLRACLAGLQSLEGQSSRRTPLPANVDLAGYSIVREAGRGGMGIVYEAMHAQSGRRVALKLLPFAATLDSRQLQRFQNEGHAASHLVHPHIVPVYEVKSTGNVHFYTMQFIDGQSLATLLRHQRRQARMAAR